jgi:hypothetical protein
LNTLFEEKYLRRSERYRLKNGGIESGHKQTELLERQRRHT